MRAGNTERSYADKTCGFLPIHLYDNEELERASNICAAIISFGFEAMGLRIADAEPLSNLSIQDMLDAARVVEAWNDRPRMYGASSSSLMVPDDRLTAAVYTLLHYHEPDATTSDMDEIVVRFTKPLFARDVTHFLLVGARISEDA